jgi:hypothetical protein
MLGKTLLVCLLFSLSCWTASAWSTPRLFFSDLESGHSAGGQDNRGAFVTLYGRGFGTERGKSRVTIGGGVAAAYPIWTDTKITFQLGPAAKTGPIVVTLPGKGVSNSLPFTVRPGTIYFVSTTGDDSHDGSFHAPWKTLVKAKNVMRPGDITYALDGVTQTTEDKYNAALSIETDGTADSPIALVAYPGARVTIGAEQGLGFGIRIPNTGVTGNYWVLAGLTLRGGEALSLGGNGCIGWRIIGNDISCPTGRGYGCVTTSRATHVKFFGNDVHDVCVNNAATISKLYHAVYFSTDSNHIEVAWNTIRNNQGNRGIQFHSSPLGGDTGYNQYDLLVHDNLISDCRGV